ncbi:MAG: hypothetical protein R3D28_08500 [Geminicoccaceae bacterium]
MSREFVANVNPLRVLTAGSAMRPIGSCRSPSRQAAVNSHLENGAGGLRAALDGAPLPVGTLDEATTTGLWCCPRETPLRRLVEAAERQAGSFLVIAADGAPLGLIGERELFAAFLRQAQLAR